MENNEFIGDMNPKNAATYNIVEDQGVSSDRCLGYTLKNHKHIEYLVKKLKIIFDEDRHLFYESIFFVFLHFTILLG